MELCSFSVEYRKSALMLFSWHCRNGIYPLNTNTSQWVIPAVLQYVYMFRFLSCMYFWGIFMLILLQLKNLTMLVSWIEVVDCGKMAEWSRIIIVKRDRMAGALLSSRNVSTFVGKTQSCRLSATPILTPEPE